MLGIQIIGFLFGLSMIYFTFLNFKKKEFKLFEFGIWTFFWVLLIFVAFSPTSLDFLVKDIFNLKRPLDFFIIGGFLFLIFLTFFNYTLTRKNSKRIEKMVSKIAIRKVEIEKSTEKWKYYLS